MSEVLTEEQKKKEEERRKMTSSALLTSTQITDEVGRLMEPFGKLTSELGELFICVICQNPMENPMATACGHSFCPDCLAEWLKKQNTCPVCRGIVTPKTVQQPVLLRDAIAKYTELKPAVTSVESYVTDLQRRVKAIQTELGNSKQSAKEKEQQLAQASVHMAELEREALEQREAAKAEHEKAEQMLRETNEKLEQMKRQLQEADRSRAAIAAKAQQVEQARRTSIIPTNGNGTETLSNSTCSQQQHSSGIWGTLSNFATPIIGQLLSPVSRQQQQMTSSGRFPTISEYTLLERRGCQAGCLVNRAICKRTNVFVALKHVELSHIPPRPLTPVSATASTPTETNVVTKTDSAVSEFIKTLPEQAINRMSEAYILSNISNEIIMKLTGLVRDPLSRGAAFYLEMPFMEFDLDWAIRERLVGQVQSTHIIEQLLHALAYLHSRCLAHRGICPASILLRSPREPDSRSQRCHIVLSSFGHASSAPFSSKSLPVLGQYHSPECFYNGVAWDSINWCAVDVWSVGAVFGEILLGKPLFTVPSLKRLALTAGTTITASTMTSNQTPAIMKYVCASGFAGLNKLLPNAPPHSAELLQLLLLRDPTRRVTSSIALNNKLFARPGSPSQSPETETEENRQQSPLSMDEQKIRQFVNEHWQGLF